MRNAPRSGVGPACTQGVAYSTVATQRGTHLDHFSAGMLAHQHAHGRPPATPHVGTAAAAAGLGAAPSSASPSPSSPPRSSPIAAAAGGRGGDRRLLRRGVYELEGLDQRALLENEGQAGGGGAKGEQDARREMSQCEAKGAGKMRVGLCDCFVDIFKKRSMAEG